MDPKHAYTSDIFLPQSSALSSEEKKQRDLFLKEILNKKRIIFFSTHLDDAILSCGSLISYLIKEKKDISVISIFTNGSDLISPFTNRLLAQGGHTTAEEYFAARRKEDKKALTYLGVKNIHHLNFTDAAWRKNNDNTSLYPTRVVGTPPDPEDQLTSDAIKKKVIDLTLGDSNDTAIFAPLGRGKHIDHVIVRECLEALFPHALFYVDFPYLQMHENEISFIQDKHLSLFIWKEGFYEQKAKAILMYKTQNISLFKGEPMRLEYELFYQSLK